MGFKEDDTPRRPSEYDASKARFVVKNIITDSNKTIRIFDYPIVVGGTRNLLAIPAIDESDIRASLLKGTLRFKILAKEIEVIESDIDLLQFNLGQKTFLQNAGIVNGLEVSANQDFTWKQDIGLLGAVDDVNMIFTTPDGIFIYDPPVHTIVVYRNGVKQKMADDYTIFEGGGPGTGFTGILMTVPPETTPAPLDVMTADYYIQNP